MSMTNKTAALKGSPLNVSPRLVSLAILKTNWNDGRSYLDTFVPFAAGCLRGTGPIGLTAHEVQAALQSRFGMSIPEHVVKSILSRAVRDKVARREANRFSPELDAVASLALARHQADLLRCHQALVEQLATFARQYGRGLSHETAANMLDDFVDAYAVQIATAALTGTFGLTPTSSREDEFIVHAFVEHVATSQPDMFAYLETVVQGCMLSSVVYLPDLGAADRKFRNSTIYLDTPFLLAVLGHLGPERAAPAKELLTLLSEYGARRACFSHTLTELRGVLSSASSTGPRRGSRGANDVTAHFMQRGYRRADIEVIIGRLERDLEVLGIKVVDKPPHEISLTVDEVQFKKVLGETVRYQREATLHHDLDSLTAIFRLRGGDCPHLLEESRALFLTTNASLVKGAKQFFVDSGTSAWPLAILDADLATLLWIKKPMGAPDLPRKQIMADCYAALRPGARLWNRYLDEIDRLASSGSYSDEDLDVMRFSPEAQRALMDRTLGDPAAVNEQTVTEVIAGARATIVAPVAIELSTVKAELDSTQVQLSREQDARVAAETQADHARLAVEAATEALRQDREERHARVKRRAEGRARLLANVLFFIFLVVIAVAMALSLFGRLAPGAKTPTPVRMVAGGLAAALFLAAWAGTGWGWNVKKLVDRIESSLAPRLLRRALNSIGEDSEQ